ncbi:hypothetical protein PHAVU_002G274100, partial [Phaseolus vulgaris]
KLNITINQGNPRDNLRNILDHAQLAAGRHDSPERKLLGPLCSININIIRSDNWIES